MDTKKRLISVTLVAPSSAVPQEPFTQGQALLAAQGFALKIDSQCKKKSTFFAGTDEERAQALWNAANDESEIVWAARGGYGAFRTLAALEKISKGKIPAQKKTLIGFSDATFLLDYVRRHWGWRVIHGPMPGAYHFADLSPHELQALSAFAQGEVPKKIAWNKKKLQTWLPAKKPKNICAPLVGGNLTVLASLAGTPHSLSAEGCILFLEDVGEALYRIDRMLQQLAASGALNGVRAIVLGTFEACNDVFPKDLRKPMSQKTALLSSFKAVCAPRNIPVYAGLPVGHGPQGRWALPLGVAYTISPDGFFTLDSTSA